jgi:hypothetical protein
VPTTINVIIQSLSALQEASLRSYISDNKGSCPEADWQSGKHVLVPLSFCSFGKSELKSFTITRADGTAIKMEPKQSLKFKRHRLEPDSLVTFYKIQGLTTPKLILQLTKRNFKPQLLLSYLVLAISRVTTAANLRIMPLPPGENLYYLMSLHRSPFLAVWMAGFENGAGLWQADRSVRFLREKAGTHFLDSHDARTTSKKHKQSSQVSSRFFQPSNKLPLGDTRSQPSGAGRFSAAAGGATYPQLFWVPLFQVQHSLNSVRTMGNARSSCWFNTLLSLLQTFPACRLATRVTGISVAELLDYSSMERDFQTGSITLAGLSRYTTGLIHALNTTVPPPYDDATVKEALKFCFLNLQDLVRAAIVNYHVSRAPPTAVEGYQVRIVTARAGVVRDGVNWLFHISSDNQLQIARELVLNVCTICSESEVLLQPESPPFERHRDPNDPLTLYYNSFTLNPVGKLGVVEITVAHSGGQGRRLHCAVCCSQDKPVVDRIVNSITTSDKVHLTNSLPSTVSVCFGGCFNPNLRAATWDAAELRFADLEPVERFLQATFTDHLDTLQGTIFNLTSFILYLGPSGAGDFVLPWNEGGVPHFVSVSIQYPEAYYLGPFDGNVPQRLFGTPGLPNTVRFFDDLIRQEVVVHDMADLLAKAGHRDRRSLDKYELVERIVFAFYGRRYESCNVASLEQTATIEAIIARKTHDSYAGLTAEEALVLQQYASQFQMQHYLNLQHTICGNIRGIAQVPEPVVQAPAPFATPNTNYPTANLTNPPILNPTFAHTMFPSTKCQFIYV